MYLNTDISLVMAHLQFSELSKKAEHIRQVKEAKHENSDGLDHTVKSFGFGTAGNKISKAKKAVYNAPTPGHP